MCRCKPPYCPKLEPVEELRPNQYRPLQYWACWLGESYETIRTRYADVIERTPRMVIRKKHLMRKGLA